MQRRAGAAERLCERGGMMSAFAPGKNSKRHACANKPALQLYPGTVVLVQPSIELLPVVNFKVPCYT